ncbi:MAG: FtsX-like permease family protein, partial [bacterium]|nr:FtsX-like permease family protein [bacterium]
LIACINFMNLSTARSANRAKEVGLRKVLGAFRKQLAKQFFGESIIFSLISLIIALILAEIALPFFNDLSGKEININYLNMPWLIIAIIGVVVFTGIIAGSYPALLLSAFKPVQVLKGSIKQGVKSSKFRSVLVVTQFAISITLIIGTTIVYNQLNYMRNKELGFDKEKLLVLELPDDNRAERYEMIKSEILQFEAVTNAAVSSLTPAGGNNSTALVPEGYENNMQIFLFNIYSVDQDFTDTYGIEIVQGRDISKDLISDKGNVCLVNETAVKQIEAWNDAIGKKLYRTMDANMTNLVSYEVVGVFKDFHTHRLYQPIEPTVFYFDAKDFDDITLKLKTENMSETLDIIKNKWAEIDPSKPFEYSFIDDRFYNQYRTEEKLGNIFRTFTFIAIFIGCLGLFGLASFITEQRTKEIGIRKTLGSSITTIIYLLCKDFIKLIVLSNVIAWPAAYFLMKNWLTKFPYQTEMSILAFMLAAIATLVIALLTVSYQSVKAAAANPMDSLRYE